MSSFKNQRATRAPSHGQRLRGGLSTIIARVPQTAGKAQEKQADVPSCKVPDTGAEFRPAAKLVRAPTPHVRAPDSTFLLMQGLGRSADASSTGVLSTHVGKLEQVQAPGHLESEPADGSTAAHTPYHSNQNKLSKKHENSLHVLIPQLLG